MASQLHLISLPHTKTMQDGWTTCAYTAKVVKFAKMMTGRDRKVILYSSEDSDAICDEHVPLITSAERDGWFGEHDENDLGRGGFTWNSTDPWWSTMNERAITEIANRCDKQDLLLIIAGYAQKPISDALPFLTVAEWGVGYEGIFSGFCAFESNAWMHWLYGKRDWSNGRWYDEVIPNFFDPNEFYPIDSTLGPGPDDYILYVGRLIERKGVHIAAMISERLGIPLKIAGQGGVEWGPGWVRYPEGEARAPGLEFLGPVGVERRAELMAGAIATLVPTTYIEPFGGVAVEAMMAGCPAVTTDWGAFRETVTEGVSGYRFRTLQEGCDAVLKADKLDRRAIQQYALDNYSLDAVAPRFDTWFDRLDGLWTTSGWDA